VKTQWNKMLDGARRRRRSRSALHFEAPARRRLGRHDQPQDVPRLQLLLQLAERARPSGPSRSRAPASTSYDEIPQDIGAAPAARTARATRCSLLLGRAGSFSMYGGVKIYVNSSPKLGPKRGIEALVAAGTDERWWVDCLQCGEPFELDTETCLKFDETGTPLEAAASADRALPGQGLRRLPSAAGQGRADGDGALGRPRRDGGEPQHNPEGKVGELVPNSRLSQRWDGLMGFRRWSDMAEQWRTAELAYENKQDEAPLKTFFQTVIGKNYTPKGAASRRTEEELLRARRLAGHRFREVPREARCVVMAVDQAVNRFEVAAWAFGPGFRAWLVDRFEILVCGDEPLRPFTRPEHFAVLYEKVLTKRYPVAGAPEAAGQADRHRARHRRHGWRDRQCLCLVGLDGDGRRRLGPQAGAAYRDHPVQGRQQGRAASCCRRRRSTRSARSRARRNASCTSRT
jgi:hypothetical protein